MRPEPLEKREDTEDVFLVASPSAARLIIDKLAEAYPGVNFEYRENGLDKFIQIRVYKGLSEKKFHLIAGFAYGFFSGIEHLFPAGIIRIEDK